MIKPKDIFSLAVIPLFFTLIFLILSIHQTNVLTVSVERFQTLIAGFMAVLAAGITVAQMRRSDRVQGIRHEQLMRISTYYPSKDIKFVAEQLSGSLRKSVSSFKKLQENLNEKPDSWSSINTIWYYEIARGLDLFSSAYDDLLNSKLRYLISSEINANANSLVYFGEELIKVIPEQSYKNPAGLFGQTQRPDWLSDIYIAGVSEINDIISNFLQLVHVWEVESLREISVLNHVSTPLPDR